MTCLNPNTTGVENQSSYRLYLPAPAPARARVRARARARARAPAPATKNVLIPSVYLLKSFSNLL